jgi:vitamin K-dependent gamma-carboxylase
LLGFVGVYLLVQVLMPLRHWVYPGKVHWTEEGHCFVWHMKLRDKEAIVQLNDREPRLMIDPRRNLAGISDAPGRT